MSRLAILALLGVGVSQMMAAAAEPPSSPSIVPPPPAGWKLVWHDEFDGPAIDKTKWDFDLGNGRLTETNQIIRGWGNDELEFYTDRPENAFIKNGMLHLRAMRESYQGFQFTSARIKSRKNDGSPLFNHRYGRYEFRAKLPIGQGIWPALWLQPQSDRYGKWAASGEIDILESKGQAPSRVQGTLIFGSHWPATQAIKKIHDLPDGQTIADFHVYALEWEPGEFRWYVDDKLYQTQNFWWSSSRQEGGRGLRPRNDSELNPWPAPFDQPFYVTMNVAVGGRFLGNPDATTKFPVEMLVDYVRVYDKADGYGAAKPRGPGKLPFDPKPKK